MSQNYLIADWSRLCDEPDVPVPLPGGGTLLLRRIPAGSFFMGARGGSAREEPRHRVVLRKDFYLGKFVVTQAEWRAVAATSAALTAEPGLDPSSERNTGDRRPVTDVSWDDATAWCAALKTWLAGEGTIRWSARPPGAWHFCLPSDAEWEYACRAGTETDYSSGDGEAALAEVGWFGEDWQSGSIHEVGEKQPNAAGLHDLHGNVWESCHDVFRENEDGYRRRINGADGVEETVCAGENDVVEDRQHRVLRGGSWDDTPTDCRSAFRDGGQPNLRFGSRGFRLCLAPGPAAFAKATASQGREETPDLAQATLPAKPAK